MEINNWYLVKIDENSDQMVFKMKKSSQNSQVLDNIAAIGGFIFSLYVIMGFLISPFNQ